MLEFLGNDVVRLNHVGDWGTQFGMLIHYLKTQRGSESDDLTAVSIGNLLEFYQKAKKLFDADVAFQTSARQEVVRLQAGDVDSVRAWQLICQKSREEFQQIYDLLGVSLTERGESYYNAMLQPLVTSLLEAGVAEKSEDAVVIFLDKYKTSDGKLLPLIVRKSDGGFLYATTDVAALKHRVEVEKARRIIYVTDAGQAQHFEMVFDAARKAGILDDKTTTVTHVPFGLVLGEDGKKIKTRAGESVKLRELLLEAVDRARREFLSRSLGSNEEDEEVQRKAVVMGMGAVKYADLSMNRESNYRFSFDKMLSLQGNTAPYMLYAYVRIRGIQRKMLPLLSPSTSSGETVNLLDAETLDGLTSDLFLSFQSSDFLFSDAAELSLARHLLRSDDVLLDVANSLYPNKVREKRATSPPFMLTCVCVIDVRISLRTLSALQPVLRKLSGRESPRRSDDALSPRPVHCHGAHHPPLPTPPRNTNTRRDIALLLIYINSLLLRLEQVAVILVIIVVDAVLPPLNHHTSLRTSSPFLRLS